jgi:membrane-associated phospholipid phosphatase
VTEALPTFLKRELRQDLIADARSSRGLPPSHGPWVVFSALLLALLGLTLLLSSGYHAGFATLNSAAARVPGWIWQYLTTIGNERVAFALTLFFSRRHPRIFWALVVAGMIGAVYTLSLKPLFSAIRPPAALEAGTFNLIGPLLRKESFPSGHTVTAAVFFGVCAQYMRGTWLRAALIFAAITVGVSRVAVGVHWPVDVAEGLAGGLLAAWLGVRLAGLRPWGVSKPSVHLVFVALAALTAATLVFRDGGYPAAAGAQRLLGCAALGCAVYSYLIEPTLRWRRLRATLAPG